VGAPGDGRAGSDTSTEADWLASEPGLVRSMVVELQRMKRRARARWPLVLALGLVLGAGLTYRMGNKPHQYTARLVLALSEGSAARRNSPRAGARAARLRRFTRLLPTSKLQALIEARNLFPLRKTQGAEFALQELRDQLELEVARNYFVFEYSHNAHRSSARVDVSILDTDGVLAFELAHDVAAAIIATADGQRLAARQALERQTGVRVDALRARLSELAYDIADAAYAIDHPSADVSKARLAMMREDLAVLHAQQRAASRDLELLVAAASADQIAVAQGDAGVGLSLAVVSETRPDEGDPGRNLRIATTIVILGLVIGLAVALVLAAFDDKVRDPDDITRAGLRVVGHLPAFPGDDVGALVDRGIPAGSTRPRSGVRV
jgi:hypothetical protein